MFREGSLSHNFSSLNTCKPQLVVPVIHQVANFGLNPETEKPATLTSTFHGKATDKNRSAILCTKTPTTRIREVTGWVLSGRATFLAHEGSMAWSPICTITLFMSYSDVSAIFRTARRGVRDAGTATSNLNAALYATECLDPLGALPSGFFVGRGRNAFSSASGAASWCHALRKAVGLGDLSDLIDQAAWISYHLVQEM